MIERFIICKTLLVKELFSTKKSMLQKVYTYLHFAHKYLMKSQNIDVNMVNLISLLYAFSILLLQINNQTGFEISYQKHMSNSVHF